MNLQVDYFCGICPKGATQTSLGQSAATPQVWLSAGDGFAHLGRRRAAKPLAVPQAMLLRSFRPPLFERRERGCFGVSVFRKPGIVPGVLVGFAERCIDQWM